MKRLFTLSLLLLFSVNVFAVNGFNMNDTCKWIAEDTNGDWNKFLSYRDYYNKEIIKRNPGIGKYGVTLNEIRNSISDALIDAEIYSRSKTWFIAECKTNMKECAGKYCRN